MKPYLIQRRQFITRRLAEVFAFFADARNLEAITPPWLNFRIVTPSPIEMHVGTLIRYSIRWWGVPLSWLTRIEEWNPPHSFVDVQLRGPYRLWHHTHRFQAQEDGTWVEDEVRYALPLGPMGRAMHGLKVRRDLETIFDYRVGRIEKLFSSANSTLTPPE